MARLRWRDRILPFNNVCTSLACDICYKTVVFLERLASMVDGESQMEVSVEKPIYRADVMNCFGWQIHRELRHLAVLVALGVIGKAESKNNE